MKIAYADPPYFGMCAKFQHYHPDGQCWDFIETHRSLIKRLEEYDGWALSLHLPSLAAMLSECPQGTRVGAWVKPFASWKPNVFPAYAWEPVLFRTTPKREKRPTARDWVSANITLRQGLTGAKPTAVAHWIFDILGAVPTDEFYDLFPGTGAVGDAWKTWKPREFDVHR